MIKFSITCDCPENSAISLGRILFSNSFSTAVKESLSVFKFGFGIVKFQLCKSTEKKLRDFKNQTSKHRKMNVHFILHVPFETPGTLIEWCRENDHKISFTKIYESSFFIPLSEIDLMVIMGGPMSVHDEEQYEWLKVEKLFIESYIANGKKVLGICLGSQLLAEVLGSRVFQNEEKEIGWWPVTKMEHSILRNIPGSFETFHWHGENFDLEAKLQHYNFIWKWTLPS